jgi:hypothetical protein
MGVERMPVLTTVEEILDFILKEEVRYINYVICEISVIYNITTTSVIMNIDFEIYNLHTFKRITQEDLANKLLKVFNMKGKVLYV